MKIKNLILFLGIFLLSFGCSDNDNLSESDFDTALIGHKWKLVGFVNGADGTTKTPESIPNKDCYWIIFNDDNTLSGKSSTNYLGGSYDVDYKASTIQITNLGGTEINELLDGELFVKSMLSVYRFSIEDKSLKLYHSEKDYLLFNIVQP